MSPMKTNLMMVSSIRPSPEAKMSPMSCVPAWVPQRRLWGGGDDMKIFITDKRGQIINKYNSIYTCTTNCYDKLLMTYFVYISNASESRNRGTLLLTAWEYHGALGLFLPVRSSSSPRPVREGRLRDPLGVPKVGGGWPDIAVPKAAWLLRSKAESGAEEILQPATDGIERNINVTVTVLKGVMGRKYWKKCLAT